MTDLFSFATPARPDPVGVTLPPPRHADQDPLEAFQAARALALTTYPYGSGPRPSPPEWLAAMCDVRKAGQRLKWYPMGWLIGG